MSRVNTRQERQGQLSMLLEEDPFRTDEDLARHFQVSVQTIRLDRLALGIPELRERTKAVAQRTHSQVRSIPQSEIVGELVDVELEQRGISVLSTTPAMAFERSGLVRGHFLFAQAETLAVAIIDAESAYTGVVNVKYKRPVRVGERVVAKAELMRRRSEQEFVVLVMSRSNDEDVFRGKFVVTSQRQDPQRGEN